MYNSARRLSKAFEQAKEIPFDDSSRIIFFSDCHRGDGSWADNFAHNKNLYISALNYYYKEGYTYIEIGDGDELWENRYMSQITDAHNDAFRAMRKFYDDNRLYMIYGNHDIVKQNRKYLQKNLYSFYNYQSRRYEPFFDGMEAYEGLILKHRDTQNIIFVVHGHQADFLNDRLWLLSRFLVRYLWRPLELYGFSNPTSPAKNYTRKGTVERRIINWSRSSNQIVIAGHTHRPMFPGEREVAYFNSGSCVHPDCITGIEIDRGKISLIRWCIRVRSDGVLCAAREIISGPAELDSFFDTTRRGVYETTVPE